MSGEWTHKQIKQDPVYHVMLTGDNLLNVVYQKYLHAQIYNCICQLFIYNKIMFSIHIKCFIYGYKTPEDAKTSELDRQWLLPT
jgi:hypothetical protein